MLENKKLADAHRLQLSLHAEIDAKKVGCLTHSRNEHLLFVEIITYTGQR